MAASVKVSGSQTATAGGTEDVLATVTDPGVYQLAVDLTNMVDAATPDIISVKIYGKARTGDTERLMEVYEFIGASGKPLFITPPLISPHHYKVSITQSQGTGRAFPWAVYTV